MASRRMRSPVRVRLAAGAVAAWLAAGLPASGAPETDFDDLLFRINLAAGYMLAAQMPDGDFRYEYDFVSGRYSSADNIVRQAGAAFAVARYLRRSANPDLAESARRAIFLLAAKSIYDGEAAHVAASGDPKSAPLGATALALIAELDFFRATGDAGFADIRAQWLNALTGAWLPGEGFAERPGARTGSPYFDGEAWLALAEYVAVFPEDAETARLLGEVDATLMKRYGAAADIGFFHWGALAADRRHASTGAEAFAAFAAAQAGNFLDRLRPALNPEVNGCYSVEGLVAAAATLKRSGQGAEGLSGRLEARIGAELANAVSMQILPRQEAIDLGGKRVLVTPELAPFAGAFLNGRTRPATRIDFTQHCLLAIMGYFDLEKPGVSLLPN